MKLQSPEESDIGRAKLGKKGNSGAFQLFPLCFSAGEEHVGKTERETKVLLEDLRRTF